MKAIDYIKRGWTQHSQARTKEGKPCGYDDKQAVAWCSIGAILCATAGSAESICRAEDALRKVINGASIARWNDDRKRTKRQVLAAFRKARI